MKIGFDIGGVISRYPEKMIQLMGILQMGGAEVYVITDIPFDIAVELCAKNHIAIAQDRIISCDWGKHMDLCKTKACEELGIDFLIDDRPDYCAVGDFIGLVVSPRPLTAKYYHETWVNQEKLAT